MNKIVIIGAGRSATTLIEYLLQNSQEDNTYLIVCDNDLLLAQSKIGSHPRAEARQLNAYEAEQRRSILSEADLVISMLPPFLHMEIAKDCIFLKKNLLNASYVSPEMKRLSDEVSSNGLLFLCEMGLDPGIDHMSAMQLLNEIKAEGGKITHFRSYTGGLVAPESDNNPWHYKFSWSPRNVVVAGQGTAQYLEQGQLRFVPYHRIFEQIRQIYVPDMGTYEVYANRDSLAYMSKYNLEGVQTLYRGTIRRLGFCSAWNALIKIGMTDSHFVLPDEHNLTYRKFLECLCPEGKGTLEERISSLIGLSIDSAEMEKLAWLGLFEDTDIGETPLSPADILERILLEKWQLKAEDKDMIIMQHEIEYELEGQNWQVDSCLVDIGQDATNTSMSRLVGLPLAIAARLLIKNGATRTGVCIPVHDDIYIPVLKELSTLGLEFKEYRKVIC